MSDRLLGASAPACYNEFAAMNPFARFGLVRLLLAGGGVILLAGMLIIGTWISKELESGHIDHIGSITSLYMESFVSPHVQSLPGNGQPREVDRTALDGLLSGTPLGRQ